MYVWYRAYLKGSMQYIQHIWKMKSRYSIEISRKSKTVFVIFTWWEDLASNNIYSINLFFYVELKWYFVQILSSLKVELYICIMRYCLDNLKASNILIFLPKLLIKAVQNPFIRNQGHHCINFLGIVIIITTKTNHSFI